MRALRLLSAPVYPFLIVALIVLGAFQSALRVFPISDAVRPAVAVGGVAALVMAVAYALSGNRDRAACVAGLVVLVVLTDLRNPVFLAAPLVAVIVGLLLLSRNKIDARATIVANAVLAAMLIPPLYGVAAYLFQRPETGPALASDFDQLGPDSFNGRLPNIIHIVLDGYSDAQVLRNFYSFDNGQFIGTLQRAGFQVASGARSPYNQTLFAMSSVFASDYVTELLAKPEAPKPANLRLQLGTLVSSGPVHNLLRRLGYDMLATESGYAFLSQYPENTRVIQARNYWLRTSLFEDAFFLNRPSLVAAALTGAGYGERRSIELILQATAQRAYAGARSPFFLYQHVLAPHPPFNVDENGNYTERWRDNFSTISDGDHATFGEPGLQQEYRAGYLAKLKFINGRILGQVQDLIANVPSPKVIIIHGDHGGGSHLWQNDRTRTCHQERMNPLFAIYSDDPAVRDAFRTVTSGGYNLVNTYRLILDQYTDRQIPPVDSRSYFVAWDVPEQAELLTEASLSAACTQPAPDPAAPGAD